MARLTNNSVRDSNPSWSPDSTRIAFESRRDGDSGIFTMNSEGTNVTRLTNMTGVDPAWSPDGNKIAFVAPEIDEGGWSRDKLYVMNADGSGVPSLLVSNDEVGNPEYGMGSPDWSPDGQWIAFFIDDGYYGWGVETYKVKTDGTRLTSLRTRGFGGMYAAWSPNGKKFVYDSPGADRDGEWALYTMNADGTDQRRIASGGKGVGREASWQPLP